MHRYTLTEFSAELKTLDTIQSDINNSLKTRRQITFLHEWLLEKRTTWDKPVWHRFCKEVCLEHPLKDLLHLDPITRRAFTKPRGYAGDAVLMDFLYREKSILKNVVTNPPIGQHICHSLMSSPSAKAVRHRKKILAHKIDGTALRKNDAAVLSVACGHLREAELSEALQENKLKRFVALDQDKESLREIEASYNFDKLEVVHGSVRDLLKPKYDIGEFDFIYSAGLYDYLNDKTVKLLTRSLFKRLKKGGKLLIANFMPDIIESGYMEAFMDWHLIYRKTDSILHAIDIVDENLFGLFYDEDRYIIYLEFMKY